MHICSYHCHQQVVSPFKMIFERERIEFKRKTMAKHDTDASKPGLAVICHSVTYYFRVLVRVWCHRFSPGENHDIRFKSENQSRNDLKYKTTTVLAPSSVFETFAFQDRLGNSWYEGNSVNVDKLSFQSQSNRRRTSNRRAKKKNFILVVKSNELFLILS